MLKFVQWSKAIQSRLKGCYKITDDTMRFLESFLQLSHQHLMDETLPHKRSKVGLRAIE